MGLATFWAIFSEPRPVTLKARGDRSDLQIVVVDVVVVILVVVLKMRLLCFQGSLV
jgi:hypothetical protein